MATQPFEARLSATEQSLVELVQAQARTQVQLDQLAAETRAFQAETRAFQADTRGFEDRITAAVERLEASGVRTDAAVQRLEAHAERTDAAVVRLDASVQRMEESGARSDRRWGELANKMGTLTEDIILPGIPTVFRTFFGEEGTVDLAVRVRRRHLSDPGRTEEYDAVASRGGVLLVAESKSSLRPEHLGEFCDKVARSREFLPDAAGKRVVGLLGSFYLDPSLVTACERQGLIIVGLGSGLLQVLNTSGFVPRAF